MHILTLKWATILFLARVTWSHGSNCSNSRSFLMPNGDRSQSQPLIWKILKEVGPVGDGFFNWPASSYHIFSHGFSSSLAIYRLMPPCVPYHWRFVQICTSIVHSSDNLEFVQIYIYNFMHPSEFLGGGATVAVIFHCPIGCSGCVGTQGWSLRVDWAWALKTAFNNGLCHYVPTEFDNTWVFDVLLTSW